MTKVIRILMILGAMGIASAYIFPLWSYKLDAPQYPEGLTMYIRSNGVTGDVDKIDIVNHYIGMKRVQDTRFVEFTIFPILFAIFILWALLVAWKPTFSMVASWTGVFTLFGALSLYDFYRWLYHYGHDLDPNAAIQINPFTPPLIGPKQLMNFYVVALPHVGGIGILAAALLGWMALFAALKLRKQDAKRREAYAGHS